MSLCCAVPGKTTWARYAFAAAGSASTTSPDGEFHRSLRDTHQHQAMYRILYEHVHGWEKNDAERSIAARLLHQFLKYRVSGARKVEWNTFSQMHSLQSCRDLSLKRVVDEILPPTECHGRRRVIVVNFDEVVDALVDNKELLTDVLRVLVDNKPLCYFCILLTSTRALKVLELRTSSQIGYTSITLPLLKIEHMYKVVQHVTRLCHARAAPGAQGSIQLLFTDDTSPAVGLQTEPRLRCFTYLLELLAGVPRFLEKALFEMGCESSSRVFRPDIFLRNIERLDDSKFVLDELLRAVVDAITTKYDRFLGHLRSLEIFPLLVTCSLFEARFYRSQNIQHGRGQRGVQADIHYIADLEDDGVIFLTKPQSSGQSQLHRLPLAPPRDAAWSHRSSLLRPWLTARAQRDDTEFCIVVPFIWMHLAAARAALDASPQSPPLPQIQLLSQLGTALTPSEKERLSLSVLALRMYFLAECDRAGHGEVMRFEVSDLFPVVPQGRKVDPSHVDLPSGCSWLVAQSTKPIVATDLKSATPSSKLQQRIDVPLADCRSQLQPGLQSEALQVFWQNKDKTQSADSFVLSMPGIALQEKQSHAFKQAVQDGRTGQKGNTVSANAIKKEHDKFRPRCPHLFVFITDKRVVPAARAQLDKCELIIDANNEEGFYGPFLARLKLCHDRDESAVLADPTESLKSWLAASSSGSPTAVAAVAAAAASASVDSDTESSRPRKKRRTSASDQSHRPSSAVCSRKSRRGG